MRLFVAVYPPVGAIDHLARRLADLRVAVPGADVRLAVPDDMHVTLAFLGDVEDGRLPDVQMALDTAARTWRPADCGAEPARLRLGGEGTFVGARSTVLWCGVTG
ncbi:2'-5' RNA ligase family protein, partial [Micromonospora zhanjiangensis]